MSFPKPMGSFYLECPKCHCIQSPISHTWLENEENLRTGRKFDFLQKEAKLESNPPKFGGGYWKYFFYCIKAYMVYILFLFKHYLLVLRSKLCNNYELYEVGTHCGGQKELNDAMKYVKTIWIEGSYQ